MIMPFGIPRVGMILSQVSTSGLTWITRLIRRESFSPSFRSRSLGFTSFLNPYKLIAIAVLFASVVGTIGYQNHEIHSWHTAFDVQKVEDAKTIQGLNDDLNNVRQTQANQTTDTQANVIKVVTVPGPVQTVVKTIHDAPLPANCQTPALDELRNNT